MLNRPALILALTTALSACTSDDTTRSGLLEPYRADLPQGNYVTSEMLGQIKVGMTKLQVRRALGTPLLTDVFLPQRWNYVFSYRHANGRIDVRRVIVLFDGCEKVERIEADTLPEKENPNDPALPGFNEDNLKRAS